MKKIIVFLLFCCIYNVGFCIEKYYHNNYNGKEVLTKKKMIEKDDLLLSPITYTQIHVLSNEQTKSELQKIEQEVGGSVFQIETNKGFHILIDPTKQLGITNLNERSESPHSYVAKGSDISVAKPITKTIYKVRPSPPGLPPESNNPSTPPNTITPSEKERLWDKSAFYKIQIMASSSKISKSELDRIQDFISINLVEEPNSNSAIYSFRYVTAKTFSSKAQAKEVVKRLISNSPIKDCFIVSYDTNNTRLN